MKLAKIVTAAVSLSMLLGITSTSVQAKRDWTITERQEQLAANITKDEKSGEMTKKEADALRAKLDGIRDRIAKMKEKNGGKLSYKDEGKIEGDLNSVSIKIKKYELTKRVETH